MAVMLTSTGDIVLMCQLLRGRQMENISHLPDWITQCRCGKSIRGNTPIRIRVTAMLSTMSHGHLMARSSLLRVTMVQYRYGVLSPVVPYSLIKAFRLQRVHQCLGMQSRGHLMGSV